MRKRLRHILKTVIFSLLPTLILLAAAEGIIRIGGWDDPRMYSIPVGSLENPVNPDVDLIWSLKPHQRYIAQGIRYEMNRLGLRSAEVGPKENGEFRILSLGESSTFGIGVPVDMTYSAQLEKILNRPASDSDRGGAESRRFRVINAGISAYSSTQSLQYLRLRGVNLQPDMVLFYHEVNDYLPTTVRDTGNHELGISMTDQELIGSFHQTINRHLYQTSALYRFLRNAYARYQIASFQRDSVQDPYEKIGHPPGHLGPFARRADSHEVVGSAGQDYPTRVSEKERLENLTELVAFCRERNIVPVIIHPAYEATVRHECLLTRFCQQHGVLMFEAYDSLHPETGGGAPRFLDSWHPTAEGHLHLARDLAEFILSRTPAGGEGRK